MLRKQVWKPAAKAAVVFAAMTMQISGAFAQSTPSPHLVVRSGARINVYKIASLNPDCTSRGRAAVNLVQAPQGGEASIAEMQDYVAFAPGNPRSACNRRKVPATEIFYRSALGFTGYDNFAAEIIDAQGLARTRRFTVEVR